MKSIRLRPTMTDVMAVQMALLNAKRALIAANATTDSQWIDYAHDDITQAFSIIQTWYGIRHNA